MNRQENDDDERTSEGMKQTKALAVTPRPETTWDTPEGIATIKQTVAKGASDHQLAMFLDVARSTGLNPFLREIWFIAQSGTIMAGRDGYLSVANRHPMFDGIESHITEWDPKTRQPIKAECKVWRKDRAHATVCEAWFHEYNKPNSQVWRQYPSAMLIKVAEIMALKRSFAIHGVVTEEEISERPYDRQTAQRMDGVPAFIPGPTDEQRAQLDAFLDSRGIDGQERIRLHAEATECSGPEEFELWFEALASRIAAQTQAELNAVDVETTAVEDEEEQETEAAPTGQGDKPTDEQWKRLEALITRYYAGEKKREDARHKFASLNEAAAAVALDQLAEKLAQKTAKAAAQPNDTWYDSGYGRGNGRRTSAAG